METDIKPFVYRERRLDEDGDSREKKYKSMKAFKIAVTVLSILTFSFGILLYGISDGRIYESRALDNGNTGNDETAGVSLSHKFVEIAFADIEDASGNGSVIGRDGVAGLKGSAEPGGINAVGIRTLEAFESFGIIKGGDEAHKSVSQGELMLMGQTELADAGLISPEDFIPAGFTGNGEEQAVTEAGVFTGTDAGKADIPEGDGRQEDRRAGSENKEDSKAEDAEGEVQSAEAVAPGSLQCSTNESFVRVVDDRELEILQRIVEAEAGDQDIYGRILVANVVLNRVNSKQFPNTIEEVVFQKIGSSYQFSPTADGRYYSVKVSKTTRKAVSRCLAGEDYSEGAMYFFQRNLTSSKKAKWFDNSLEFLFKYGCHEFFKG